MYLGVARGAPDGLLLDRLMAAYVQRVPWESAFRIVKRARTEDTAVCPRWPDEFWTDALERGGGGTCFESNYAFFSLLRALGYTGYLTINDMGDSIGCHTAIIIWLAGRKWLVDVGLPLYVPLPVQSQAPTHRASPHLHYTVRPTGPDRYEIERRPHPQLNAFTLIDRPVADGVYRAATTADYGANGLFLDRVIVNKVVGGLPWRFNGGERPYHLQRFVNGQREDIGLEDSERGDVATAVATHFGMHVPTLRAAFAAVQQPQGGEA